MAKELILLVDDEPNITALAQMYLTRENFRVQIANNGHAALEAIRNQPPDLLVLDLMLPEVDGYEICRQVRATSNIPIIMLTARDDDLDKIIGLELGADDYMTKPFNPRELVARVRAILRRVERPNTSTAVITLGNLVIDSERREVQVADQTHNLRTKEFDLLHTLAEYNGRVLSRDQLLNLVWGFDFGGQTRTVDVHIAHLRKVLAGSQVRIDTVTGVGYKLVG